METKEEIRAKLELLHDEVLKEDGDSPLRKTLLEKIDELKKDFVEIVYEMNKPEDIRLAELLHKRLCHSNHADACDWHYGDWERTPLMYSRAQYLEMAHRILEKFTYEEATSFVELLK